MPPPPAAGSFRRDLVSAYAATIARVASWAIISAIVFRASPAAFGVLALIRATVGILNYTTLGLGPSLIHSLSRTGRAPQVVEAVHAPEQEEQRSTRAATTGTLDGPVPLNYAGPGRAVYAPDSDPGLQSLFAGGLAASALAAALGLVVILWYAATYAELHAMPARYTSKAGGLVVLIGLGTLLRLISDAPGAVLQTQGRIALDNRLVAAAEGLWVAVAALFLNDWNPLGPVAFGHFISGAALLIFRLGAASAQVPLPAAFWRLVEWRTVWTLLRYGSLVALAQIGDFLFAPVDYILINRFLSSLAVAMYAPAVQIDAGLLLLVGALASVLLPRTAVADAAGDRRTVRAYYVRGTLASVALLAVASVIVWLLSPWIFRLWLGSDLPQTRAILPLVLTHTVIGGSTAVGRSVLIAVGKVKPFTVSVLATGALNVILSYVFVRYFGWGLRGIVLGTVVAAVARGVLWMPWYVLRTLRQPAEVQA